MRALPMVIAADPVAHAAALELLVRAMELTPRDPVPMALAAWCTGQPPVITSPVTCRPNVTRRFNSPRMPRY